MKSSEYWSKRYEALNNALLNRGEQFVNDSVSQFRAAQTAVTKEIEAFYGRFAKNNGVTMADAKKLLDAGELAEFRWTVQDYIKYGQKNPIDGRWTKQLENASIRVRVSRLEALETQIRQNIEALYGKQAQGTADTLAGIYENGFYRSVFEIQKG
ncbi:MAG: phage head morphogenesis protein, partial [Defluviitaleaceae bacterium]|nr:phage head morphogenesis protein [Defluviitaleaceae bacterium]